MLGQDPWMQSWISWDTKLGTFRLFPTQVIRFSHFYLWKLRPGEHLGVLWSAEPQAILKAGKECGTCSDAHQAIEFSRQPSSLRQPGPSTPQPLLPTAMQVSMPWGKVPWRPTFSCTAAAAARRQLISRSKTATCDGRVDAILDRVEEDPIRTGGNPSPSPSRKKWIKEVPSAHLRKDLKKAIRPGF